MNIVNNKVKFYRTEVNITQKQLAQKANISERQLRRIECQEDDFRASTICSLAKALNVSPDKLLDFDDITNKA